MSALADPGENFGPEVNPNPIQVTGNAGDAYNLGYEHGYADGLKVGRTEGRAELLTITPRLSAELVPDPMEDDSEQS